MKKLSIQQAEILAGRFRALNELGPSEPIEVKTLLRELQISIMYRPLSSTSFGISCKSPSNKNVHADKQQFYQRTTAFYDRS